MNGQKDIGLNEFVLQGDVLLELFVKTLQFMPSHSHCLSTRAVLIMQNSVSVAYQPIICRHILPKFLELNKRPA
jgi:hypothetical protein